MKTKVTVYIVGIVAIVGGITALADAMVTTEREELEAFADAVTGPISEGRIDTAFSYADPATMPIEIISQRTHARLRVDTAQELSTEARQELTALQGKRLDILQQSVDIRNGIGHVALRLRTEAGVINTVFRFRRHEDRWLVYKIAVS